MLFAGTTFHDDTSLGETCSTTGCACNRSWAELEAAHKHDKRRYARYLTAIQRRGTQVVYMSMFPRCKDHCGAPDFLRAFADDVAHHEVVQKLVNAKRMREQYYTHRRNKRDKATQRMLENRRNN